MKLLNLSLIIISFVCSSFSERNVFQDYFNADKDTTLISEFTHYISDTTVERVFLKIRETKYNDAIILSNVFFNREGNSLSSGIEYFYPDNSYQFAAHSLYELDSLGNSIEVKGNILNNGVQSFNKLPIHFDLMYQFKSDSALTLKVETEIYIDSLFVDSLKDNCLLVNSISKINTSYSDGRVNKNGIEKISRVYFKRKGLIRFEMESNGMKKEFVLTNKYYR